jgi:hypothetical protein
MVMSSFKLIKKIDFNSLFSVKLFKFYNFQGKNC